MSGHSTSGISGQFLDLIMVLAASLFVENVVETVKNFGLLGSVAKVPLVGMKLLRCGVFKVDLALKGLW